MLSSMGNAVLLHKKMLTEGCLVFLFIQAAIYLSLMDITAGMIYLHSLGIVHRCVHTPCSKLTPGYMSNPCGAATCSTVR